MRPLPAQRLPSGHGLLRAIDRRGRLRPEELVTDFSEAELFPPDAEPDTGRTRQYLSLLRAAGLIQDERGALEPTDFGRRYLRAGDPSAPFAVSPGQAEWLRRALRERHLTDSIWHGAAIGLSLCSTLGEGERVAAADFGRAAAHLGRTGWDNENTFRMQGERFTLLLRDMELVDPGRHLTDTGRRLVEELRLPVHTPLITLAGQLHPGGPEAVARAAGEEGAAATPPPPPAPAISDPGTGDDVAAAFVTVGTHAVAPPVHVDPPPPSPPPTPPVHVDPPPPPPAPVPPVRVDPPPPPVPPVHVDPPPSPSPPPSPAPPLTAGPDDATQVLPAVSALEVPPVDVVAPPPVPPPSPAYEPPPAAPSVAPPPAYEPPPAPPPVAPPSPSPAAPPPPSTDVLAGPLRPTQAFSALRPEDLAAWRAEAETKAATTAEPAFLDLATVRAAAERRGLRLDDGVYAAAIAALASGRHLVLTGGAGQGKTTLALALAEAAQEQGRSAGPPLVATADDRLSARETLGRHTPAGFAPGLIPRAIGDDRWLLLDELDRARLDKALGRASTLLAGRALDGVEPTSTWRVIATMADLSGVAETSPALRRRFVFIEVPVLERADLERLVDRWAAGDDTAAAVGRRLVAISDVVELGPGLYQDAIAYVRTRRALAPADETHLTLEALAGFVLPQLEGQGEEIAARAVRAAGLSGP